MRKTLSDAFEIEKKDVNLRTDTSTDYGVFKDKELLDNLRSRVIQNIIDNEIPEGEMLDDYINSEIDNALEGYDLSNFYRKYKPKCDRYWEFGSITR